MSRYSSLDIVFVAGPPGAGKTSVTEGYQRNNPGVEQFGTGDLVWDIGAGRVSSKYAHTLKHVAEKGVPIPDDVFSMVVQERIMRVADSTETVMITGFPYAHSDWGIFTETIPDEINLLGSVALTAGLDTCVARMQERDMKKGLDAVEVNSIEARVAYEKRYLELMGRLTIRFDCYKQSGISVVPILAERPRDEVLADFSDTMNEFKEGKK